MIIKTKFSDQKKPLLEFQTAYDNIQSNFSQEIFFTGQNLNRDKCQLRKKINSILKNDGLELA